jgi:hypothetical protein
MFGTDLRKIRTSVRVLIFGWFHHQIHAGYTKVCASEVFTDVGSPNLPQNSLKLLFNRHPWVAAALSFQLKRGIARGSSSLCRADAEWWKHRREFLGKNYDDRISKRVTKPFPSMDAYCVPLPGFDNFRSVLIVLASSPWVLRRKDDEVAADQNGKLGALCCFDP